MAPMKACSAEWQSGIGLSSAVRTDVRLPVGATVTAPATPAPPSTSAAAHVAPATDFHNLSLLIARLPWGSVEVPRVYPETACVMHVSTLLHPNGRRRRRRPWVGAEGFEPPTSAL